MVKNFKIIRKEETNRFLPPNVWEIRFIKENLISGSSGVNENFNSVVNNSSMNLEKFLPERFCDFFQEKKSLVSEVSIVSWLV